jgi:hypothetical protein
MVEPALREPSIEAPHGLRKKIGLQCNSTLISSMNSTQWLEECTPRWSETWWAVKDFKTYRTSTPYWWTHDLDWWTIFDASQTWVIPKTFQGIWRRPWYFHTLCLLGIGGPHRVDFLKGIQMEIKELEQYGTWNMDCVKRRISLSCTWTLKIKKYLDWWMIMGYFGTCPLCWSPGPEMLLHAINLLLLLELHPRDGISLYFVQNACIYLLWKIIDLYKRMVHHLPHFWCSTIKEWVETMIALK